MAAKLCAQRHVCPLYDHGTAVGTQIPPITPDSELAT